jgi:FKBP-type peptidyl-prolyl cis-trans isomerase
MKVGGLRRLVVPPSLAYGTSRNSSIPPNATLVFDIELVSLQ